MERVLQRIEIIPGPLETPCWLWTGVTGRLGYVRIATDDRTPTRRHYESLHRVVYRELVGPIPEGLEIDHLCRARHCCNPDHLEPVTHAENVRRGERAQRTHCPQSHLYDEANTYRSKRGSRECRQCGRERRRTGPRVGEHHPHAKLTDIQVAEIRARYQHVPRGQPSGATALAREFGISRHYVRQLVVGKWRVSEEGRAWLASKERT